MTCKCTKKEPEDMAYGFYSKLLKKPFDSVEDLKAAEADYFAEQKAKEDRAAVKKADAAKVEDAFKALNQARRDYKEKLTKLTEDYRGELTRIKDAFEVGRKDIHDTLAMAEDNYASALKEFTTAHPEGYHVTLKDGDFETTIDHKCSMTTAGKRYDKDLMTLFDLFFNL